MQPTIWMTYVQPYAWESGHGDFFLSLLIAVWVLYPYTFRLCLILDCLCSPLFGISGVLNYYSLWWLSGAFWPFSGTPCTHFQRLTLW